MTVHYFNGGFTSTAIAPADLTRVRLYPYDNLPEVRPPRRWGVVVVRVNSADRRDFHGRWTMYLHFQWEFGSLEVGFRVG